MNLTPEQQALGRRNFLKALAGTPALAALRATARAEAPGAGGPVRVGFVGVGAQGRVLLDHTEPASARVVALCDINPVQLAKADDVLARKRRPSATHYTEWKEMLQKEDLEAVIVAVPLWMHAEVASGCLEAGKHVLCEKMIAWDLEGAERMRRTAVKSGRVLEIGYQRFYNPIYQAAYEGVVKAGLLGDVYHARLAWHRNANWRRPVEPIPDYDPARWGYPDLDHLINWRLFSRYSKGLFAELASHQVNVVNWFWDSSPEGVLAHGGLWRFPQDREVYDHVYAIFQYPHGRTATFTSIESNAFEHYYELFMGTKGTLLLRGEKEAYLFGPDRGGAETAIDVTRKSEEPVLDASETKSEGAHPAPSATPAPLSQASASELEISAFCAAVRGGKPVVCGPERAIHSAAACLKANEAVALKTRVAVSSV